MANINYQNPNLANVSAVLDSEVVGTDSVTGQELRREFVVPFESISGNSADTQLQAIMLECLIELKKIRVLLEQDVPPGLAEDDSDETLLTDGQEEQIAEGIEEE